MTKLSTLGGVVKVKKADGRVIHWDARDAVAFWSAKEYSGAGNLKNLARTDGLHDMVNNGAKFLPFDGEKYVYFPGVADNYVSTPDAATLDISGDLDVRIYNISMADWTPVALGSIVAHWRDNGGFNQRSWMIRLQSDGTLRLYYSLDGINLLWAGAPVALWDTNDPGDLLPDDSVDVKMTRVASTGSIQFYHRRSGASTWIAMGAAQAGTPGTLFNSNTSLTIGGHNLGTGNMFVGSISRIEIRKVIDGAVDISWSAEDMGQTGGVSGGRTWTINRATTGLKSVLVDRPLFLFGTDDYMETPDHADLNFDADDSFSVVAVVRRHHNMATDAVLVGKAASGTLGWRLWVWNGDFGTYMTINDGVINSQESYGPPALSIVTAHVGVRDVSSDKIEVHINGEHRPVFATDATTGPLTNTNHVRIARDVGGNTAYMDGEFMGAAIFRRALTDAEILEVGQTLGAD